MGMFDYVNCQMPISPTPVGNLQTKDFDDGLDLIVIKHDGSVLKFLSRDDTSGVPSAILLPKNNFTFYGFVEGSSDLEFFTAIVSEGKVTRVEVCRNHTSL